MQLATRRNACQLNESVLRSRFLRRKALDKFAVMLPEDPAKDARVLEQKGKGTVFASVRKERNKDRSQDVAIASIEEEHSLIGVFDGFQKEGDFIPSMVAEELSSEWHKRKQRLDNPGDFGEMLYIAAKSTLESANNPFMRGGTTAVVASIDPNGIFFAACSGDSAAYKIDCNGRVSSLFEQNEIFLPPGYVANLVNVELDPKVYVKMRNVLVSSISRKFTREDIQVAGGMLEEGSRLLLVSDGITKNLFSLVDEKRNIKDITGCKDLEWIISGIHNVEEIGAAILDKAKQRAKTNIRRTINDDGQMGHMLIPADDDMAVVVFSLE
jgi:serine/threonine protein phosphatase PrpC